MLRQWDDVRIQDIFKEKSISYTFDGAEDVLVVKIYKQTGPS